MSEHVYTQKTKIPVRQMDRQSLFTMIHTALTARRRKQDTMPVFIIGKEYTYTVKDVLHDAHNELVARGVSRPFGFSEGGGS